MISPKIIQGILVGLAVAGLVLLGLQWWITGSILFLLGAGLYYLWWRFNRIGEISQAVANGDTVTARKKLAAFKNPDKLNPISKTYFYYLLGMTEIRENNFKEARTAFKSALEANYFRTTDEKASVYLMMAQLDLRSRNTEGAKRYLRDARDLEPSDEVKNQINFILKEARIKL